MAQRRDVPGDVLNPEINDGEPRGKKKRMPLNFITWDVQHGSAAFIGTPNNQTIAIDLGAGDFSPLEHIRRSGITQLDEVIITHPHLDYIDDILNFDLLQPRILSRPRHLSEDEIWAGNQNASAQVKSKISKYCEINSRYNQPVPPNENPMAGFRATPIRRIPVLYGMKVYVIRFNNQHLHR